jgi:hypothetical protein
MTSVPSDAPYDTRNKNIYGLGVGISIVFEIFSNFQFLGEWG